MRRALHISSRWSTWLPAWLLLAGLVLAQTGMGAGLLEVAKSDAGPDCLDGCPCETDAHAADDGTDHGACPDGFHDGCPPSCDECACCAGIAVAVVALAVTPTSERATPDACVSATEGAPRSVSDRVFQPPERSVG